MTDALQAAIALLHAPANVRTARNAPLPAKTDLLLRIAADDKNAAAEAAELSGRPQDLVSRAACFFIEQVFFSPEADSYRILGANRDASTSELRERMALLLRWLHPDVNANANGHKARLARRVVGAWEELKTPERRRAYDHRLPQEAPRVQSWRKRRRMRGPASSGTQYSRSLQQSRRKRRLRPLFELLARWLRVRRERLNLKRQ